ncbi:protein of unknown function [Micropruina glycogenica]|uniref:Uncharacterized protein n=1 Tax=Micropruina glycogenica TaxID=75385 RepID=A0A2N9JGG2_9ACTN|nr:protein of unknown function [Micropruina glycogenica]
MSFVLKHPSRSGWRPPPFDVLQVLLDAQPQATRFGWTCPLGNPSPAFDLDCVEFAEGK